MAGPKIPTRRRADPARAAAEPSYIDIFDQDIPEDQEWYWNEDGGAKTLRYQFAGAPAGTMIRSLSAMKLEKLFEVYGHKTNMPLGSAVRKYYDGLLEYITSEHRWRDVFVPFGKTYRGLKMNQVLDKGWMLYVRDDDGTRKCRERYPLFFGALKCWLENPRVYEVMRDAGRYTESWGKAGEHMADDEEQDQPYSQPSQEEVDQNGYRIDGFVVADNAPLEYDDDASPAVLGGDKPPDDRPELSATRASRSRRRIRRVSAAITSDVGSPSPLSSPIMRVSAKRGHLVVESAEVSEVDSPGYRKPPLSRSQQLSGLAETGPAVEQYLATSLSPRKPGSAEAVPSKYGRSRRELDTQDESDEENTRRKRLRKMKDTKEPNA
ncbi:hypothetical protein PQX77_000285 [Marasmius sp. AFHP31]|nr:hypothetical protein PQX77_000285 [Marasmius sp. AFHP31]